MKIAFAGQSGWQQVQPPGDVQLAGTLKRLIWDEASQTSMEGVYRDRYMLGLVKTRLPRALEVFGESAVKALLRERTGKTCGWCALQVQTGEPPTPTEGLRALFGTPCSRCEAGFQAREVARRERAVQAAGQRRSWSGASARPARKLPDLPRYYGSRQLGQQW